MLLQDNIKAEYTGSIFVVWQITAGTIHVLQHLDKSMVLLNDRSVSILICENNNSNAAMRIKTLLHCLSLPSLLLNALDLVRIIIGPDWLFVKVFARLPRTPASRRSYWRRESMQPPWPTLTTPPTHFCLALVLLTSSPPCRATGRWWLHSVAGSSDTTMWRTEFLVGFSPWSCKY